MPFFNVTAPAAVSAYHAPSAYHPVAPVTHYPTTTLYPVTQTHYTTVYETVLPAACETSSWLATYTVTETCTGNPTDYVTPVIPPGFVVTKVACHACKPSTEIEITCPGAQPTGAGYPTVSITGNGVTATVTAYPTATVYPVTGCSGSGKCSGGSSGSNPGSGAGSSSGSGSRTGSSSGSSSSSGTSSGSSSGSGSGSSSGSGTGSGSASTCGSTSCISTSSCNGSGGRCGNVTTSTNPPVVTAGAPSLKNAFAVFSGLVFVAGHFLIL
ncbi:hypothetical protein F5Y06DRAFT_254093 [Hypoxylon sp. FL0890]|nr:hypothetical protein F5Y06DRAFT_254093 [Hypoxylon sp. FL0890]